VQPTVETHFFGRRLGAPQIQQAANIRHADLRLRCVRSIDTVTFGRDASRNEMTA
jgi:hypothetical protein